MELRFSGKCNVTRAKALRLFEIARVLVRFNHVASFIAFKDKAGARVSAPGCGLRTNASV